MQINPRQANNSGTKQLSSITDLSALSMCCNALQMYCKFVTGNCMYHARTAISSYITSIQVGSQRHTDLAISGLDTRSDKLYIRIGLNLLNSRYLRLVSSRVQVIKVGRNSPTAVNRPGHSKLLNLSSTTNCSYWVASDSSRYSCSSSLVSLLLFLDLVVFFSSHLTNPVSDRVGKIAEYTVSNG